MEVTVLEARRPAMAPDSRVSPPIFLIKAASGAAKADPHSDASLASDGETPIRTGYRHVGIAVAASPELRVPVLPTLCEDIATLAAKPKVVSA